MDSPDQSFSLKDLSRDQIIAVVMLSGFGLYTIWDQLHWWSTREDYSFGFLVPLFVSYVIYDRWSLIKTSLVGKSVGANDEHENVFLIRLFEWVAYGIFCVVVACSP